MRSMRSPCAPTPCAPDPMRSHALPISVWVTALKERLGWQKAAVALANKNARILWAVMTKGDAFDARHVSVKPQGNTSITPAFAIA